MTKSQLEQRLVLGKDYREDFEFDLYGEEVTVILKPLPDKFFLPIVGSLADELDVEDDVEDAEVADEAIEEAEGDVEMSDLNEGFVNQMQKAAILGIEGGYDEDGEKVEYDDEKASELVDMMMGGTSVEIGGRVLELTGSLREAEKFR